MDALTAFISRPIYEGDREIYWTLDYELIHELILKALLEDSPAFLASFLPNVAGPIICERQPKLPRKGLYDLSVTSKTSNRTVFFELKTWTALGEAQIDNQLAGLRDSDQLVYLLFGRGGSDWPHAKIEARTNGRAIKYSYREVIGALEPVAATIPLAAAYKEALILYRDRIVREIESDPDQ